MLISTSAVKRQKLLDSNPDCKITINDKQIEFQESMEYLGIKIDHLLKFDEHVEYIKNKIAKKVGYLKRISGSLSPWAREIVFNTTIDPHFKYCSSILLGLNHQDISALQKLQNKGMRAILHCHYLTHRAEGARLAVCTPEHHFQNYNVHI